MTFIRIFALFSLISTPARAGTFSLPHFTSPGEFALGLEPELVLTNGAGIGVNARFTEGLNDLMNVTGLIGTGEGPRRFRVGGNVVFDFFPDVQGQPGIGIAAQGIYYRLRTAGQFELTAIPYLHKTYTTEKSEVEPFISVPFGMAFSEGRYRPISSITIGSMFKASEHVRYVIEFGMAVNNTESYISGGIVYYH